MRCYGIKIFLFILIVCLFNSAALAQHDRFYFRDFESSKNSDLLHCRRIADKIKHLADECVPSGQYKSRIVIPELDRTGVLKRVEALHGKKKNELIIHFPGAVHTWDRDTDQLCDLIAWYLLAKLDRSPEQSGMIRSHWIVRALARKIEMEEPTSTSSLPFVRSYPIAYALASNGILPTFDSILTAPPAGAPVFLRMLSDEYASLLLEICRKSGLLRGGLAERLLISELGGYGNESLSFFTEAAGISLRPKTQEALLTDPNGKEDFFFAWFELYANHMLLTFFTPVSAERFEVLYRKNAVIRITDKKTMEIRSFPISALKSTDGIPEAADIAEVSRRLARLAAVAPTSLLEPLSDVRCAVEHLETGKAEDRIPDIVQAEKKLISAVGHLNGIERFMEKVQARQIAPGARLASGLQAAWSFRQKKSSSPAVDKLLDKWDE